MWRNRTFPLVEELTDTIYLHVDCLQADLDSTWVFSLMFYWPVGISALSLLLMSVSVTGIWQVVLFYQETESLHAYALFFLFLYTSECIHSEKPQFLQMRFHACSDLLNEIFYNWSTKKLLKQNWHLPTIPVIHPSCTVMARGFTIAGLCDWQQQELRSQPDSFPCRSTTVFHLLKNTASTSFQCVLRV